METIRQDDPLPKTLLVYGASLGVALAVGYLLADPLQYTTVGVVGLVLGILSFPILLRWYHPLLLLAWNANMVVLLLPGQPTLGIFMSIVGLGIALFNRALNRRLRFVQDRGVTLSLFALGIVVLVTAQLTHSLGMRSLGGESFGGKKYFLIFAAICGYFALVSQTIPWEKARFWCAGFQLTTLTSVLGYLVYFAGPTFYFLFNIFPPEMVGLQGLEWSGSTESNGLIRLGGLSTAATAICSVLLLLHGVRGLFTLRKSPWLVLYGLSLGMGMLGGFRSVVILNLLIFVIQFFMEGLHRTRLLPLLALSGILVASLTLPVVHKLPLSIQRSLAFLPLDIDPVARKDASDSAEWRLNMWRQVVPTIPQYFWVGKGYGIDPTDLYFAQEAARRGLGSLEPVILAGDYHSGPLSVIIPFGIFGTVSFLSFFAFSLRVLYRHYRASPPGLKTINTFLFACFVGRVIFFFAVFGSISSDLMTFVGLVGLSLCVNRHGQTQPGAPSTSPA